MPAAKQGLRVGDPTIAELLKPALWHRADRQNHLGDRNEYLPMVHGFDECYGILYHLNGMEGPYDGEYLKIPGFHDKFGPRNVIETSSRRASKSMLNPDRCTRAGARFIPHHHEAGWQNLCLDSQH
jgi:arylsulfatase A-like enzyme